MEKALKYTMSNVMGYIYHNMIVNKGYKIINKEVYIVCRSEYRLKLLSSHEKFIKKYWVGG